MMLDPGSFSGIWSVRQFHIAVHSASSRTSFAIFIKLTANCFSAPWDSTMASWAGKCLKLILGRSKRMPREGCDVSQPPSASIALRRVLIPVPTAVPPRATSLQTGGRGYFATLVSPWIELRHITAEFLADRKRRRVHQMGTTNLYHIHKLLALGGEGIS